ncbi:DinB family protein [Nakamurella panacisegetis]|nr:DinB family protein [Nakamurella panacisegetis]
MATDDQKTVLHDYLRRARQALVWKLDGLSEYDVRRPLTGTGTNLLGLVQHVASVGVSYFGETFGRPFPEPMPWLDEDAETNADMWVPAERTRPMVLAFQERAWAHADATIDALDLDSPGHVAWWPPDRSEVTLHRVLVHMIAEADRHAGQADIVRELIDGRAGLRADGSNLPERDEAWWSQFRATLEESAASFRSP